MFKSGVQGNWLSKIEGKRGKESNNITRMTRSHNKASNWNWKRKIVIKLTPVGVDEDTCHYPDKQHIQVNQKHRENHELQNYEDGTTLNEH